MAIPGPDGHQVGVVCGGGDRDAPGAASVRVAELVGQGLQFVRGQVVVVPQTPVVGRPTRPLEKKIVRGL